VDDSATSTPFQDVGDVINSVISLSRARRAVLREVKNQNNAKRFVEIWHGDRIEASMEVTEAHGMFYTDGNSQFSDYTQEGFNASSRVPRIPGILLFRNIAHLYG
jgi:hypothetical protein